MQEEKSASLTLGEVQEGCLKQSEVASLLSLSSPLHPSPHLQFQPPQSGDAHREKEKSPPCMQPPYGLGFWSYLS